MKNLVSLAGVLNRLSLGRYFHPAVLFLSIKKGFYFSYTHLWAREVEMGSVGLRNRYSPAMRTATLRGSIACVLALIWAGHVSAAPRTFYVSKQGSDANPGTSSGAPLMTIQAGVDKLTEPGDQLLIAGGEYTEFVRVTSKPGTAANPIRIAGMPGAAVKIQGSVTRHNQLTYQFHVPTSKQWVLIDSEAHEYESSQPIEDFTHNASWSVSRGAFLNGVNGRHTRLITYSNREDLTAKTETFEPIFEGPAPCPHNPVTTPPTPPRVGPVVNRTPAGCVERRPWSYMGPGIWFNPTTNKVHIRLDPTHNQLPGIEDYNGPNDPNAVALAIAEKGSGASKISKTLSVIASKFVTFENLSLAFGGETVRIENSSNISFDGVTIRAGQFGVRTERAPQPRFTNSVLDGGLPPWLFRTDIKEDYVYIDPVQPQRTLTNTRAKATMESLVRGTNDDNGTTFHHCEFVNAHDLYLHGANVDFHHNWIDNLNDDSLFLDDGPIVNGSIHHNVITQALTVFSFAGGGTNAGVGPWYIFRNLVDLRKRMASYRPQNEDSNRAYVRRSGIAFKSNSPDPTYHVFQNTFVVSFELDRSTARPGGGPSFNMFREPIAPGLQRTALNNLFIVFNREKDSEAVIATMADPSLPASSVRIDGNLYYRRDGQGPFGTHLFLLPRAGTLKPFTCMGASQCQINWKDGEYFKQTQHTRPPGDEPPRPNVPSFLLQDPGFVFWHGELENGDDFRLASESVARGKGVPLPAELDAKDRLPATQARDIGAYQSSSNGGLAPKLRVGVRGRIVVPR